MSWNLRSRNTLKPRATIQRTGSGPATTNISLPTLRPQSCGSRRSASDSARIGFAKSSATMTRGLAAVAMNDPHRQCVLRDCMVSRSCVTVGTLSSLRRVRFPFLAAGTAPIVLPRAKAAVVALVEAESLEVLADQALDELEIMPAIR